MHTMNRKTDIMMGSETNDIIEELRQCLLQKYQKDLEESMKGMKGREFGFDIIDLLYYHLQKIGLKRSGLYIDSPVWLKNKKQQ